MEPKLKERERERKKKIRRVSEPHLTSFYTTHHFTRKKTLR
jgi:hypothetical protein